MIAQRLAFQAFANSLDKDKLTPYRWVLPPELSLPALLSFFQSLANWLDKKGKSMPYRRGRGCGT